jgi:hypothetical protein
MTKRGRHIIGLGMIVWVVYVFLSANGNFATLGESGQIIGTAWIDFKRGLGHLYPFEAQGVELVLPLIFYTLVWGAVMYSVSKLLGGKK